jgi:predicted nucleotidyltransferase
LSRPRRSLAILYGSRAPGRHRPASDIDLTLIGPAISAAFLARIMRAGVELYRPRMRQTHPMATSSRPSSYHYVVDEPLLRTIAAEIQAAIPGAQVRLFGSRARGTERPDSDLDLLVTVPDAWLACHSRFEETGDLCRKLAHHRIPIDLLLYSDAEVQERRQYIQHVVTEAFHNGRDLYAI